MQRRAFLGTSLVLSSTACALPFFTVRAASGVNPTQIARQLAAAWDDDQGRHWVGVLALTKTTSSALSVLHQTETPSRAHGLMLQADGTLVAVARRPGEWLLKLSTANAKAQWFWNSADRRFCGHVITAPDGTLLTTETDVDSLAGLVVQRDPHTLAVLHEWPSGGVDPHQLLLDQDGTLLVANGGVLTQPESGRVKLKRRAIDSSLVRMQLSTGEFINQWRLPDRQLSLRHLARHPSGVIGVAMQAEHELNEQREHAPLLALLVNQQLHVAQLPMAAAGYAGDIAATAQGFALSATRAGQLLQYKADGQFAGAQPLTQVCSLTTSNDELWAGGSEQILQASQARQSAPSQTVVLQPSLRLDNHWIVLSQHTE